MDDVRLRAWWWHRQALDGRLAGKTSAEVLAQTGWARSVGGAGPYLTLHARNGASREGADAAVASLEIHELPSARGCTYVVPAADFGLALTLAQEFGGSEMRAAEKTGVTTAEIDRLCEAIVGALQNGPLEPEALRHAVGGAARSLGEEGKKKGVSTTLPIALGRLQVEGEIRRIPTNGRLDQQRYRYALWRPGPPMGLSREEAHVELARRYFMWTGPATMAEFQWFSGLGARVSKAAIEPLNLVPVDGGRLMFAQDREDLQSFQVPRAPAYSLVSSIDAISLLRRDVKGLLAPEDWERSVCRDKSPCAAASLSDLPSHAILDRGRLIGLWEYDVEARSIAWTSFGVKDAALDEAVRRTEAFVRDELGDARSFSLDSPKTRAARIEALRAGAGLSRK